jgi:hypothetical protein
MHRLLTTVRDFAVLTSLLPLLTLPVTALTAELPLVRIAHGAFSEKVSVLWVGAEQRIFRKHGVNVEVEVINIRSGPPHDGRSCFGGNSSGLHDSRFSCQEIAKLCGQAWFAAVSISGC